MPWTTAPAGDLRALAVSKVQVAPSVHIPALVAPTPRARLRSGW